jgi:hypothetical protein
LWIPCISEEEKSSLFIAQILHSSSPARVEQAAS